MPYPKQGILSPMPSAEKSAIYVVTVSRTFYATSEDFRLTVIGGGCGGQAGNIGGASAGQSVRTFRGVPVGTPIDIVIGAAGLGGINGGAARTAGGTTTATVRGQTSIVCQGGQTTNDGGTASGGDINITGQRPMMAYFNGTGTNLIGGDGGSTVLGHGGRHNGAPADNGCRPGLGFGAGGSGGFFNSGTGTSHTAGNGTQGVCVIENL